MLVLENHDARIPKVVIKPKNNKTKVTIHSKMYNEETDKNETIKIKFDSVVCVDFSVNYFDNMIGAEAFGLYEIDDEAFIDSVVNRVFERRREIYLLEGDYNYDENEPADLLNVIDLSGRYRKNKHKYHAYIQNVDAGVYIIIAKGYRVKCY